MPRLEKLAKHLFRDKQSNPQQMLTIFLNESKDESIRDFVINRNPEFAFKIVRPDGKDDESMDREVAKFLEREEQLFKTLNTVRFENLNRYFKSNKDVLQFCARDKTFKPGSGHFDFIFDLKEKKDQTMKAKFDYLEKHPLRKFEAAKHSFGVPYEVPVYEDVDVFEELEVDENYELNKEKKEEFIPDSDNKKIKRVTGTRRVSIFQLFNNFVPRSRQQQSRIRL